MNPSGRGCIWILGAAESSLSHASFSNHRSCGRESSRHVSSAGLFLWSGSAACRLSVTGCPLFGRTVDCHGSMSAGRISPWRWMATTKDIPCCRGTGLGIIEVLVHPAKRYRCCGHDCNLGPSMWGQKGCLVAAGLEPWWHAFWASPGTALS